MKYNEIYDRLVKRGQHRNEDGYFEKHHIIPKCLGGSNNKSNLVKLTPEEHFLAHQLLVKIYPNVAGLTNAVIFMCTINDKNIRTNKIYGWIRRAHAESVSGGNNPAAKLTNEQALEVYKSNDTIEHLCNKYNLNRYNVISIKRKIYYKSATKDISELPGYSELDSKKGASFPLPIDRIEDVFYDTGDFEYFREKYRITPVVVKSIKSKKSFKKITSKLGIPGAVKRYGMTQQTVDDVYNAEGTNKEIAERFNIHYNTVRNIKSKYSRAFNMWEEF